MYAVIETGGKQYRVQEGDRFRVERLKAEIEGEVVFDKVLMVGGDGLETRVGTPYVQGATVTAQVLDQARDKKVLVFKYKSKKNYRRMRGHRQYYTEVVIRAINA